MWLKCRAKTLHVCGPIQTSSLYVPSHQLCLTWPLWKKFLYFYLHTCDVIPHHYNMSVNLRIRGSWEYPDNTSTCYFCLSLEDRKVTSTLGESWLHMDSTGLKEDSGPKISPLILIVSGESHFHIILSHTVVFWVLSQSRFFLCPRSSLSRSFPRRLSCGCDWVTAKHNRLNIALFSLNILFLLIGLALGSVWVVLNAAYIE